MSSHRILRVRELIKRQLGEDIRREIPVAHAGVITVTDVELSKDLRHAKVSIGLLGSAEQQRKAVAELQKNRVHLQGLLAKSVILKYTPQLRFVFDDSVQRGNRVLAIIDELEKSSEA